MLTLTTTLPRIPHTLCLHMPAMCALITTQMLLNLHKKTWMTGLQLTDFKEHSASNEKTVKVCVAMVVVSCGIL